MPVFSEETFLESGKLVKKISKAEVTCQKSRDTTRELWSPKGELWVLHGKYIILIIK